MSFRRKWEGNRVVFIFLAGICYSTMMILAMPFFRSPKAARSPHVTLQTVMFPDIAKQCDTNTSAPLYYVTVPCTMF